MARGAQKKEGKPYPSLQPSEDVEYLYMVPYKGSRRLVVSRIMVLSRCRWAKCWGDTTRRKGLYQGGYGCSCKGVLSDGGLGCCWTWPQETCTCPLVETTSLSEATSVYQEYPQSWAFLVAQRVKNMPAMQETWVWSLGLEDPLEKEMQPTPVFLLVESYRQRSLVGYSPWGRKESDTTKWLTHTHTPHPQS